MMKKLMLMAAMAAAMTAAVPSGVMAGENDETQKIEAWGLLFEIPAEYKDLVTVQTEGLQPDEIIRVSETASIEAAKAAGMDEEGAGWLFSISHISEQELGELRCGEMSGRETFAEGDDGVFYLFNHPTDVRLIRESDEEMNEAMDQWEELNNWAFEDVRMTILADNPQLELKTYSNTELDMYLARARFAGEWYEIRSLYTGKFTDTLYQGDDAALEDLTEDVFYDEVTNLSDEEKPDGEYIVMSFDDDNVQFNFFLGEGLENYIRERKAMGDGTKMETLYRAGFRDPDKTSTGIMKEWIEENAHPDDER